MNRSKHTITKNSKVQRVGLTPNPPGYATVTSCMSLCKLQRTVTTALELLW